jgi:hypothetical protein
MTSAIDYADATRKASAAFTTTLYSWKKGVTAVTDQFRAFPAVGALPTIDVTEASSGSSRCSSRSSTSTTGTPVSWPRSPTR